MNAAWMKMCYVMARRRETTPFKLLHADFERDFLVAGREPLVLTRGSVIRMMGQGEKTSMAVIWRKLEWYGMSRLRRWARPLICIGCAYIALHNNL